MDLTSLEKERLRKNEYQRKKRKEREAAGMCNICGKRHPIPGMKMCPDCQARKQKYNSGLQAAERKAEYCRRQKQKYANRLAQGLCGVCGKRPFRDGKSTCPECAEKLRTRAKLRYTAYVSKHQTDPRKFVAHKGTCSYCHAEEVVYLDKSYNRWLCEKCYVKRCQAIDGVRVAERMKPKYRWLDEVAAATV